MDEKYKLTDAQAKYVKDLEVKCIKKVDFYLDVMEKPDNLKNIMIPMNVMEEVVPIAKYIMEYLEKKSIYAQFIDPKDARQYCDPNYFLDSYSNDLPCHLQLFD